MDDSSIPPMAPQEGGNKNPADKKTGEKSTGKPNKKLVPANAKKGSKTKPFLTVSGVIAGVIEVMGLVLWQLADIFRGFWCDFIHWISIDCFIAGAAIFINKALDKAKHIWILWILYAGICFMIAGIIYENSNLSQPGQSANVIPMPSQPQTNQSALAEEVLNKLNGITKITSVVTNIQTVTNTVIQTNEPVAKEWEPPPLPTNCDFASITYGESEATNPTRWGAGINLMLGRAWDENGKIIQALILGAHITNNELFVDAIIPGESPFGPFKISGNKITGRLPPTWQMNYDFDAIEIVNGEEIPICQIIYKRPDVVDIYGAFGNQFQVLILTPDSNMQTLPPENWYDPEKFNPASMGLRRIFKYPFWAYKGQRVEYSN